MSKRDLAAGRDLGEQLVPMLKACEKLADDPVHFWAGLISSLTGIAVAAIGKDAAKILLDASATIGTEMQRTNTQ